jgi:hypothetical protein
LGASCGKIDDGCGTEIDCSGCGLGYECAGNSCLVFLSDGLVSFYDFEIDASDVQGNNPGTFVGDAASIEDVARGKVLGLDGAGDYVDITENFDLSEGELSMSIWFYLDDQDRMAAAPYQSYEQYALIGQGNSYWGRSFYFYLRTQIANEMSFGANRYSRSGNVDVGVWTHVVGIIDGDNFKLYQNNYLVTDWTKSIPSLTPINDLMIGYMPSLSDPKYFEGKMDNVRIYNKALTAVEVADLYDNENV